MTKQELSDITSDLKTIGIEDPADLHRVAEAIRRAEVHRKEKNL